MPSSAVDIGTGASLTLASSAWEATLELISINWSGYERESVETTHLGTTAAKTFMPGDLYDPGTLEVEFHMNPDLTPPLATTDVAETITITFAETATWSASGFMVSHEFGVPLEDKMTGTASFKLTGAITVTAAA